MGENSCGPVQFEAMKRWLVDAGFIKKETKGYSITKEANLLSQLGADDPFVWGIIWVNLAKNSSLISWYVDKLEWGKYYSREELLELMGERLSLATRKNALQSLCEIFKHTPLGDTLELGILKRKGRKVEGIEKRGLSFNLERQILLSLIAYTYYIFKKSSENRQNYFLLQKIWGLNQEFLDFIMSELYISADYIKYEETKIEFNNEFEFLNKILSKRKSYEF
ncbi:MAG: hypothetical protein QW149_06175 [Nitrososphaerota archaeon]